MTAVTSSQLWQPKRLNQSGIRRLKIVDASALLVLKLRGELVPQRDFILYEFIFPADLSCSASIQRQVKDTGAVFWIQTITFNLPHIADAMVQWAADHAQTRWLAIAEDYNGFTNLYGGCPEGLLCAFQATTGSGPRDVNPMSFTFSAEQLLPYLPLATYNDDDLFPSEASFSYGFSTGFNS
jgi:hypothetical protein